MLGLHGSSNVFSDCVRHAGRLNLIDMARLAIAAPHLASDLPAGGLRLLQCASGYVTTWVRGVVDYREGQDRGALPGQLVQALKKLLSSPPRFEFCGPPPSTPPVLRCEHSSCGSYSRCDWRRPARAAMRRGLSGHHRERRVHLARRPTYRQTVGQAGASSQMAPAYQRGLHLALGQVQAARMASAAAPTAWLAVSTRLNQRAKPWVKSGQILNCTATPASSNLRA